jgi:hypothetical protein
MSIVEQKKQRGFSYIGRIGSSSKIEKNSKVLAIDTYVTYLAPANLSGHNVCPKATTECIGGCLNKSGRAKMNKSYEIMTKARIAKTKHFYDNRNEYVNELVKEIEASKRKSERNGNKFAVRLNGTSDLSPLVFKTKEANAKNILEVFPKVKFYDYTKVLNRIELTKKYKNYDVTFSYTGYNWQECLIALENNVRVAVVFNIGKNEALPKTFNGYKVVSGDNHDYRPNDKKNVIVGLKWKSIKDKNANELIRNSAFVVQPSNEGCVY